MKVGSFPQAPRVSVVVTTYNEAASIESLLASLVAQSRPPDEVIICDGGSTDGTDAIAKAFAEGSPVPVRVLARPGANISQGRNVAIASAAGPVVAVTDAGVRLDPQWLEKLTAPFRDADMHIVGGFYVPDPRTVFELALGATTLERREEIDPERFAPSSRSVAFRKAAWEAVGGYPEWLDYCEDVVFDALLVDRYGSFRFVDDALVYFRPRSSLAAYLQQYRRYARGDGKAGLNWHRQHRVRYAAYLIGLALGGAGLLLHILSRAPFAGAVFYLPALVWLLASCVLVRVWSPYRRLARMWQGLRPGQKAQAALWVPVIRVAGDLVKAFGYLEGLAWRWRNRRRGEIHWKRALSRDADAIAPGPARLVF